MDIEEIRNKVKAGDYEFRKHALEKAGERGIDPLDVKSAILEGEILESYPDDPRGSSCLIYGRGLRDQDIHVVCGLAENKIWIITAYVPEDIYWVNPKTRRQGA